MNSRQRKLHRAVWRRNRVRIKKRSRRNEHMPHTPELYHGWQRKSTALHTAEHAESHEQRAYPGPARGG